MADQTVEGMRAWFADRVPKSWFTAPPEIIADQEEIIVIGTLPDLAAHAGSPERLAAARAARIDRFRQETRDERMQIAAEAERRFRHKVAWGASIGDLRRLFTTLSVPVMTRLRMPERAVLDTLVASGVARSRSDALAWCVRLVGKHQADWIKDLRDAFAAVEKVRAEGPTL